MDGEAQLRAVTGRVSALFRSHGGSVEVADSHDGAVEVRFGGMCSGCPSQALCLEHTVGPRLLAVPGVRSVTAPGARLSVEAATRVSAFLAGPGDGRTA